MVWLSAVRFARWMVSIMALAKLGGFLVMLPALPMLIRLQPLWLASLPLGLFAVALFDLHEADKISYEDALRNADSVNDLRLQFKLHSQRARNRDLSAGTEHMSIM